LPHVIDVEEAMAEGAPLLHDDLFTQGIDPKPKSLRTSPNASPSQRAMPQRAFAWRM
jgi:CO/xanthine dehydrogenase Mo-binding subunit